MTEFDAHAYSITIRRADVDGERLFVASVRELPDLKTYEASHKRAYDLTVSAIKSLHAMAKASGRPFPQPDSYASEFSGRVTLRLPISLHRKATGLAEREGVSLNTYLVSLVSQGCAGVGTREKAGQQINMELRLQEAMGVRAASTTKIDPLGVVHVGLSSYGGANTASAAADTIIGCEIGRESFFVRSWGSSAVSSLPHYRTRRESDEEAIDG